MANRGTAVARARFHCAREYGDGAVAGSRTYRTCALVLDKVKLKETDLILTLLADSGRQVRAVAKGARKPGGRLAARCELFSTTDFLLARGRTLDVVSQAELLEAPLGSTPTYERMGAACAVADIARLCCFEDAEDPFIFSITQRALQVIGEVSTDIVHLDIVVAAYAFKVLSHIGYRPDFSSCVACGDAAVNCFSASAGGLLCGSCASSVPGAEEVDAIRIGWLRAFITARFDELVSAPVAVSTASHLLALAHLWAATHLDARLRALEFMLGC